MSIICNAFLRYCPDQLKGKENGSKTEPVINFELKIYLYLS
jgi:hypothetical protein